MCFYFSKDDSLRLFFHVFIIVFNLSKSSVFLDTGSTVVMTVNLLSLNRRPSF